MVEGEPGKASDIRMYSFQKVNFQVLNAQHLSIGFNNLLRKSPIKSLGRMVGKEVLHSMV